jgi:hypothetical protein
MRIYAERHYFEIDKDSKHLSMSYLKKTYLFWNTNKNVDTFLE